MDWRDLPADLIISGGLPVKNIIFRLSGTHAVRTMIKKIKAEVMHLTFFMITVHREWCFKKIKWGAGPR